MKIGVDGRFVRRNQTGNGVFTQLFLEGLARLDSRNEYTVYLLSDIPFIEQENFCLRRMPALHANPYLRFCATFPLELLRRPVDVFHAIYTLPLLPPRRSIRTVLSLIEFAWFTNPEEFPASSLFLRQVRLMQFLTMAPGDGFSSQLAPAYMKKEIQHLCCRSCFRVSCACPPHPAPLPARSSR